MGTTPVTLDFSKAQSLAPTKPDTTISAGVTLDFSKAQPIAGPGASTSGDFWQGSPSVPGLPIQQSMTMTPEKMKAGAITAGETALAGAAAGSAALGASAALAPTATAETVGTGILDASGQEIMREVTKYGSSLGRQGLVAAGKWVAANPGKAAVAYMVARHLGIPLPNIFKLILGTGE